MIQLRGIYSHHKHYNSSITTIEIQICYNTTMIILGIETSCDETAAAVLEGSPSTSSGSTSRIQILSNVVASSASIQAKYGGIIPEQAAREQLKSIIPVIETALEQAAKTCEVKSEDLAGQLNAVAVTQGPGLIGSLLVGVETAKVLARIWNKPLIPVNHLLGHFYANWIQPTPHLGGGVDNSSGSHLPGGLIPTFPCIGLLVSGGHTDLVLFKDHGKYEYLGGTRDDAAGECFDKCARLLGLPYPGGPEISGLAAKGKDTYKLPRPMIDSGDFDFSFSGLKTAVARVASRQDPEHIKNLAASIEAAIVDVLVKKTILAARNHNVEQIIVAGGVAANRKLINDLKLKIKELKLHINVCVPAPALCTDNAAMIAAAALFLKPAKNPLDLQADPNLSLAY